MAEKKAAVKSLGFWGGATGLVTLVYKLSGLFGAIPSDLISDSQTFVIVTITTAIALIGRWRATVPLGSLLKGE